MKTLPEISFSYYALHYLNLWRRDDSKFLALMKSEDRGSQLKALKDAAALFRVARNLPNNYDQNKWSDRYEPILEIIKDKSFVGHDDPTALAEAVQEVSTEISKEYGGKKKTLSATTKLLWVKFQSPIIIYDQQARTALQVKRPDLAEFYRSWRRGFDEHREKIVEACEGLAKLRDYWYPNRDADDSITVDTTKQPWFHERVFDIYLWHKGA